MGLNQNQLAAVEYLDGPLLVLAGPGTGKTQLLSEKVAYILENTDVNPENILCLTFTESGATNMRERLGSIMGGKDSSKVNISTERFESFRNIRSDINRNLNKLKELGVDIPEKVEGTINGTSLQDFTCLEDCNKYFEKLGSVLRTIIVYY